MISILIPTYKWNSYRLVKQIISSIEQESFRYEIHVIDDGSGELYEHQKINELNNCYFHSLQKNIGRSRIRNLLIQKANYSWLLFLDGDVMPSKKQFISKYMAAINDQKLVIVGGIKYQNCHEKKVLRWKLGKRNEEKALKKRLAAPYKYFFTGNFLIHKSVFNHLKFDESITRYGYEDLLFARQLQQKNIPIQHIQNEVYHLGIDANSAFIAKTKEALDNLSILLLKNRLNYFDTKISQSYSQTKWFCIPFFLSLFTSFFEKKAIATSLLFYFNLFRLGYLYKMIKKFR